MPSSSATRKFANDFEFEEELVVPPSDAVEGPLLLLPVLAAVWRPPPQLAPRNAIAKHTPAPRSSRLQRIPRFNRTSRSFVRRPNPRPHSYRPAPGAPVKKLFRD